MFLTPALRLTVVKLSIIVPTHNEAENIPELVDRISKALNGVEYEVIFVDDASTDGTRDLVRSFSKRLPVKLVERPSRMGIISAVFDGLKLAQGEYVAVMDADLQHPPEHLPEMLKLVEDNDVVIGSRFAERARAEGLSWFRRFLSKTAILLAHTLLPASRKTSDPLSGFFLVRRSLLNEVEGGSYPRSFKVLLYLLARAERDIRVVDVPINFGRRLRGRSKLGLGEMLRYLWLLLALSRWRPVKFAVVGASGILVNLGVLYALLTVGVGHLLAGAISIEASIISNFVFNDLWTFSDRRAGNHIVRIAKWHGAMALGALVNYVVYAVLSYFVHYLVAMFVGIIVAFVLRYLLSEFTIWSAGTSRRGSSLVTISSTRAS